MPWSTFTTRLTQFAKRRNPNFCWRDVWLQWFIGMYVATPIIALLQGTLLLNDYRVRYGDAPRPVMPARGVAVAVDEDDEQTYRKSSSYMWRLRHPFSAAQPDPPPIRLLVVGDSLAAGVGMSKSGVPILPESIARAISKALQGRPVYWTCIGTPGVAASQIVKDIHDLEPYDPHPKARQVERIVKQFQLRRRRWHERKRQEENGNEGASTNAPSSTSKNEEESSQRPKNYFKEWWKQIRQNDNYRKPQEIQDTTKQVVAEWWSLIRNRFRQKKEQVEADISAIKEIVLEPLPRIDDVDDDYYYDYYRKNGLDEEVEGNQLNTYDSKEKRIALVRKGSLFRRSSVNPEAAAQYDIAVVLTGLNDVKYAFMPHMAFRDSGDDDAQPGDRKLRTELYRVLDALRGKMAHMDLEEDNNTSSESTSNTGNQKLLGDTSHNIPKLKRPLVVVPELPVAPLQLFQLVPLCWFLVPIFKGMESNKKFLASCFPEYVVFVEQPDLHWWTDTEAGIGPVKENIEQEQLLLRATDIARNTRERIQRVMKKYYDEKREETSPPADEKPLPTNALEHEGRIRMIDDHDHFHYDEDNQKVKAAQLVGNKYVSVDQIHPNDEGM